MEALRESLYWGALGLIMAGLLVHQVIMFLGTRRPLGAAQAKLERDVAHIRRAR